MTRTQAVFAATAALLVAAAGIALSLVRASDIVFTLGSAPATALGARYSFTGEEYIHPRIVEELVGLISDSSETVTSVDLLEGNDSNRFFGDFDVKAGGWVEYRRGKDGGWFSYRHIGTSPSGVHVLFCSDNGGGSGIFRRVVLLAFREDTALESRSGHVATRRRLLLRSMGSISLGDRYSGPVTYDDGVLTIGADESPMRHGGRHTPQEIRID